MKQIISTLSTILLILSAATAFAQTSDNTRYVDPFIGTTNYSVCNPGAVLPHGLMSVVPFNVMGSDLNVKDKDSGWWSAPYEYNNKYFTAHPIYLGGKLFDSIENLYLCAMNNQGLLALAQLILPSEILTNFEVVRVEEEASLIRIYLDESVKVEYKENPEIESKGFCEAVTIRDFPIRDKGVDLIVRRRKWYDKQNNRYFSDSYELKAEGTRYSKEFAAFLKGVYGDDPYDLPFA